MSEKMHSFTFRGSLRYAPELNFNRFREELSSSVCDSLHAVAGLLERTLLISPKICSKDRSIFETLLFISKISPAK